MNILEVMKDTFTPFMDGEKRPLHVGEVFNLWNYLAGTEQILRNDQAAYNIAHDQDLKEKMRDLIENVHKPMIQEMRDFLLKEGIPLPQATPEKSVIPLDTSRASTLTDEDIANDIIFSLNTGITLACSNATQSLRADVGYMFMKYQMMKMTFSITFRPLMEEKGWLKVPPYYKANE